jgi:hypothetical protein
VLISNEVIEMLRILVNNFYLNVTVCGLKQGGLSHLQILAVSRYESLYKICIKKGKVPFDRRIYENYMVILLYFTVIVFMELKSIWQS